MFRSRRIRTARCLLTDGDRHLLVVHAGAGRHRKPRWGLPGGHLDAGEHPEDAVRRELEEELELRVDALEMIDDYFYKGSLHRVYTAPLPSPILRFDDRELLQIGWHTADEIERLALGGILHAGYEHEVVRALAAPCRAAG
ncbi:MAG TPA: NUDIX hydrolase [Pseudomonadales bacterium]|nr:NUDIX hydrolase [Pseudomonadales bacterium]